MNPLATMPRILFVQAMLAFIACGPDKPAESPPVTRSEMSPAEAPPPPPAPTKQDASAAKVVEEPSDPAFADAPAKPLGREEIHVLVKSLPLRGDAIRFEAIDKFLLLYAPFTANKVLLRETRRTFRVAQKTLLVEVAAFSLSNDVMGVARMVRGGEKPEIFDFLRATAAGVSSTRNLVVDFYEKVRDREDVPDAEKNQILGQIGSSPHAESYAGRNLDALESLRASVEAFRH